MRTPISDDVRHKWLKLDKKVVELLLELEHDKYKDYVLKDGSVIVEMDKLSYGYVEAAHYWWEELKDKFEKDDYAVSKKISVFLSNTRKIKYPFVQSQLMIVCLFVQKTMNGSNNRFSC